MKRTQYTSYQGEQFESSQKDSVISSLKKELYELKDVQSDVLRLNDDVLNIESKNAMLEGEKQRVENEHKYKLVL